MSFTQPCLACGQAVYPLESIALGKGYYHKACAKCAWCQVALTVATFAPTADGQALCKIHYVRAFGESGGKYATTATRKAPAESFSASQSASTSTLKAKPVMSYATPFKPRSLDKVSGHDLLHASADSPPPSPIMKRVSMSGISDVDATASTIIAGGSQADYARRNYMFTENSTVMMPSFAASHNPFANPPPPHPEEAKPRPASAAAGTSRQFATVPRSEVTATSSGSNSSITVVKSSPAPSKPATGSRFAAFTTEAIARREADPVAEELPSPIRAPPVAVPVDLPSPIEKQRAHHTVMSKVVAEPQEVASIGLSIRDRIARYAGGGAAQAAAMGPPPPRPPRKILPAIAVEPQLVPVAVPVQAPKPTPLFAQANLRRVQSVEVRAAANENQVAAAQLEVPAYASIKDRIGIYQQRAAFAFAKSSSASKPVESSKDLRAELISVAKTGLARLESLPRTSADDVETEMRRCLEASFRNVIGKLTT